MVNLELIYRIDLEGSFHWSLKGHTYWVLSISSSNPTMHSNAEWFFILRWYNPWIFPTMELPESEKFPF